MPFYLISNVARIMGSHLSFRLVIINEHPKALCMYSCIFSPLDEMALLLSSSSKLSVFGYHGMKRDHINSLIINELDNFE